MTDFLQQIHAFRLYLVALPPEELEQVQTSLKIFSAWWKKERTISNKALSKEPWAVAQPIQQTRWADALVVAESVHSLGYNWLVGNLSECPLLPAGNFPPRRRPSLNAYSYIATAYQYIATAYPYIATAYPYIDPYSASFVHIVPPPFLHTACSHCRPY